MPLRVISAGVLAGDGSCCAESGATNRRQAVMCATIRNEFGRGRRMRRGREAGGGPNKPGMTSGNRRQRYVALRAATTPLPARHATRGGRRKSRNRARRFRRLVVDPLPGLPERGEAEPLRHERMESPRETFLEFGARWAGRRCQWPLGVLRIAHVERRFASASRKLGVRVPLDRATIGSVSLSAVVRANGHVGRRR